MIKYMVIRFVIPLWASIDVQPLPSSEVISTKMISITWRNWYDLHEKYIGDFNVLQYPHYRIRRISSHVCV